MRTSPIATAPPSPALLDGARVVVTGVLTPRSIAFSIAEAAQRAGAEVVLTSYGRAMSLTERSARRLSPTPAVLTLDATSEADLAGVAEWVKREWGAVDGVVHAIGFAPADCLGGNFLEAPWESVATAMQVSAYSLAAMARQLTPLMPASGGSLVTLTFDASVAWPLYDWMGPAKAALESVMRYLARDLGQRRVRVNAVSAGPIDTMAAKSIPGFGELKRAWEGHAPLGWDVTDPAPVADTVAFLLSRLARGITGEVIHVDGGYHALGAPLQLGGGRQ